MYGYFSLITIHILVFPICFYYLNGELVTRCMPFM